MKKFNQKGITLIDILVSITIIAIVGFILSDILVKGFKGSNKSKLIGTIKQNGQSTLNILDQTIRRAYSVACIGNDGTTGSSIILRGKSIDFSTGQPLAQASSFVRFKYVPEVTGSSPSNGKIIQDSPTITDPSNITPDTCDTATAVANSQVILTDTNLTSGVSVKELQFKKSADAGAKDVVTVEFKLGPPLKALSTFDEQTDNVDFKTTVQIR